jgi:hypothetical protein
VSELTSKITLLSEYLKLAGTRGGVLFFFRVLERLLKPATFEKLVRRTWMRPLKKNIVTPPEFKLHGTIDKGAFVQLYPRSDQEEAAERISQHNFDFLGTGPVNWQKTIDWHWDPKSSHRWPTLFFGAYGQGLTPGKGVDIKVPWELSRFHHFVPLAQAAWLSDEGKYASEYWAQWRAWVDDNPWGYGINWTCAMEVSIRAINWLYSSVLLNEVYAFSEKEWAAFNQSLRQHGIFIENNLEFGVVDGQVHLNNHYLSDICGLACLGLSCPHLPEAKRWRRMGIVGLESEIKRQVLADGFSFESSTSYHRLALELFLLPALLAPKSSGVFSDAYWDKLEKMVEVVYHLSGPDGNVAQIGDNDDGRLLIPAAYPHWQRHDYRYLLGLGAVLFSRGDFKERAGACPEEVFWFLGGEGVTAYEHLAGQSPACRGNSFAEGGIYIMHSEDRQDYALIRAGEAVKGTTGHFHNDVLSLELWAGGHRVLVDPGTSVYSSDPAERNLFRSTAMHNTVKVDGVEINEIPANLFCMGRQAEVWVEKWETEGERYCFIGEHNGYSRLAQPVRHRRQVNYEPEKRVWTIIDELSGEGEHVAEWNWHFPTASGASIRSNSDRLTVDVGPTDMVFELGESSSFEFSLADSERALSYGVKSPSQCLNISVKWLGKVNLKVVVGNRDI